MKRLITISVVLLIALSGCKKKSSGPGGPGGAWLVGQDGLMADLGLDDRLGDGYDLGTDHDLLGIACKGLDTAFVVGELGTLLRTFDGGESWDVIDLETTRTLRSIAIGSGSTIYVGGDALLTMSRDAGTTWTRMPVDPASSWLAVASGHDAQHGALALDTSGQVWREDVVQHDMVPVATLAGARVVAASHDGAQAVIAGSGRTLLRSRDAGSTWTAIDLGRELELHDAWVTVTGVILAVGADGVVARIDAAGVVSVSQPGAGTLRSVHINGAGRGLAAGDDGEVLSTRDGGATWTVLDLGLTGTVFGVDEVNGDGHL